MAVTMTRTEALAMLAKICDAIVETVNEAGDDGAPIGVFFAAFMARGMSLETFQAITNGLVDAGIIVRRGDLFYPAAK